MDRNELEKIVMLTTKECRKNFNEYKTEGFTLAELTVIPFVYKEISTRKVSDWGTDEERDEYLWYSENGWQYADMVVQVGAGVSKVIAKHICELTEDRVLEILLEWGTYERMMFISDAYKILDSAEYRIQLY